jgi:hypothetical protein
MGRRKILLLALLALSACAAGVNDAAQRIQNRFVGGSVDALVVAFGPPASSFKMDTGETAYVWQLASTMSVDQYSANMFYCKINVIASVSGTVTRLTTQDAVNGFGESLCATRLGMSRQ